MAKLLYFALLFGVFHNFLPAFVVSYQEYNWDKITFKTDLIADYIIQEKKNVYVKIKVESVLKKKIIFHFIHRKDLWTCNYHCMKSNKCNAFNQTKQKDCTLYKLHDTGMETFCKNPLTGFIKMEGFIDLWVDANLVMVGECTPICPEGFYSFPNCKGNHCNFIL